MKPEKQLYQWDVNQYLTGINPAAQYVDYTIGNEVIRIKADGTRCRIPDELLQTDDEKTCYERYQGGTYRAYSFTVLYAPKPPDYVYTPEERTTFEALTDRVDSAIEEIKRRADSGEFTPKKGVDYFTDAEKSEMMESVSDGAIGEFREVVDTATTDYNRNAAEKLEAYNSNHATRLTAYDTNAEQHTTDYNRNAAEKLEAYNSNHATRLTAYDTNAEQHTTDYNRNATEKTEAYNSNAQTKLTTYNSNAEQKLESYNTNAETKTAEFDANAAALQEQMAKKANADGYYEEMTVGDAEQLISSMYVENSEPYGYRTTGGSADVGNRAYLDKIVGGTVAWNQIFKNTRTTSFGITITNNSDGSMTINGTTAKYYFNIDEISSENFTGHKYMLVLNIIDNPDNVEFSYAHLNQRKANTPAATIGVQRAIYSQDMTRGTSRGFSGFSVGTVFNDVKVYVMEHDLTQMFGSTIADYIYSLEQSQAGAGVAWFKKLFPKDYYEYNAGELLSVEGLQSHDVVGFNQWDEEWEVGSYGSDGLPITSNDNIRTKNRIIVKPSTAYYFKNGESSNLTIFWYDDNDTVINYESVDNAVKTSPANAKYLRFRTNNYGTTYNHDICINLSSPSRNGEYEPYEKHSYPLDSSLTLRGIPKLDASNNLYYDGDEYASDGKVKRKYGVVDLGTLNWHKYNNISNNVYYAVIGGMSTSRAKALCSKFVWQNWDDLSKLGDGMMQTHPSLGIAYFGSEAHTDATAFKTAMSGVMLVYELATPTTETAEPFQHIQIVDDFGTEEFVSTGIVPVGHKTRYPANLRDKLQHLPDLAGMDGTYLIRQTGKQMSLVHTPAVFPETPTEDGTYTLKTVVTGGVATLQWVVE